MTWDDSVSVYFDDVSLYEVKLPFESGGIANGDFSDNSAWTITGAGAISGGAFSVSGNGYESRISQTVTGIENGVYDINRETGAQQLGDIVISMEKAVEQAERYGHSLQREVGFLTVHSMLHLLGYDHEAGGIQAVHMREKEETVLKQLGLERDSSYVMEDDA